MNIYHIEPLPDLDCNHIWVPAGPRTVTWNGSGTGDTKPPSGAPMTQRMRCLYCGGVEERPAGTYKRHPGEEE